MSRALFAVAVIGAGVVVDYLGARYLRPIGDRWAAAIERWLTR